MYSDDLPSKRTLDAELDLWAQKWTREWEERWKKIQLQHFQATGEHLVVTPGELKKLKQKGVPSNIASTLTETTPEFFPNIYCLLTTLAVLPVTSCEAERCISCLRRLKTYLRSSMGVYQLLQVQKLWRYDLCSMHITRCNSRTAPSLASHTLNTIP